MSLQQAHKLRLNYDLLESDGSASGTKYYEGKLFSGFAVFDYFQNGNVMYEEEYVKGELMGWTYLYHTNGNLKKRVFQLWESDFEYHDYDENGIETDFGILAEPQFLADQKARYGITE